MTIDSVDPGRLILPAIRWQGDGGFGHAEPDIAAALELGVGGFILFGGTVDAVRTLTGDLVRRAGRPLLFASDLERGAGQQIDGLTQLPPPLALAALGDLEIARWAGAVTAAEARSVGINWVFAPVADLDLLPENPIVQTRAFGAEPAAVGEWVRAWIEGCQGAGALACAKHFPGHGRTTVDSHVALPVVDADAETLERTDERPFAAAVAAGVASMMTAHVAYSGLDPFGCPATRSPSIIGRLRAGLGFEGVLVTDALNMEGAMSAGGEGAGAVEALRAGVDLLLYPSDPRVVRDAIEVAVRAGELSRERMAEAYLRYRRALDLALRPAQPPPSGPYESSAHLADALLDQGLLRGTVRGLTPPLDVIVVDDDIGGPYPPGASDDVAGALDQLGLTGRGVGGSRIVLVFAEPRAWKGRAGLGPEARATLGREAESAALIVLFAHPRLAAEVPGAAPILLAWHRQRLMQAAVARWIAARA